jgi:hypothetical protein
VERGIKIIDKLDLYFRAHTIPPNYQKESWAGGHVIEPENAVIFHCVPTADEEQDPLCGAYVCAQLEDGKYVAREIGLFYREGHPEEVRVLKRFVKGSAYELGSLEEFRRKIFLKYLKAGQLIVAYDAPFQISRIAVKSTKSLKHRRAFSFYFRLFKDKQTGKVRPSPFDPGLSIQSLDAWKAICRPIKYKFHDRDAEGEEEQQSTVHILDLKTMTGVLTGEAQTFSSAREIFGVPGSRTRKVRRRVTKSVIESLLADVVGQLELLNRVREELQHHPLNIAPERCYSPATLSKGYFAAVGIKPPQEKFNIPDWINGIASQSFAAGRAECNVTRTPLPITYLDFFSQFPAISSLLDCREILCAESLEFADFTNGAIELAKRVTLDDCFRPEFWKKLRWFALVEPYDDLLPVRAKFGTREDSDPTLGWNFLLSRQPLWVTGLDVLAAKVTINKPIKILKAIQVVPHGIQPGLKPVKLYDQLEVDPLRDDLAVKLIELRTAMKAKDPELAAGLKVAANSAAFGLLCQLNVKDLESPSPVQVFSGEANYKTPPEKVWEQPAELFCPVIASLVTGGSHLFCAMLERSVRDMGGQIAAMDTDSAMIVSTKDGGLVPCAGGPHRLKKFQLPSRHAAIKALSHTAVDQIRNRFEAINPWRSTLNVPFLKLEKDNFDLDGKRQQLYAYCIAAKLYCLYNLDGNRLLVRKPSGHGLGFLKAPYSVADWHRRTGRKWEGDLPPWVFEAWHFILSRDLNLPHQPPRWLKQAAVMVIPISTPQVMERLGCFKDDLRPFTVVTVPFPKKEINQLWTGCFVMPFAEKLDDLHGRPMMNVVSGATFYIYDKNSSTFPKPPGWLALKTMEDEINQLLSRAESKFCTPNGSRCTSKTMGLLVRRHIVAGEFHYIGKEASTRWTGGPDFSMMAEAGVLDVIDETCREYERVVDPKYLQEIRAAAKEFATKRLSRKSGLAECAIRNFKKGKNTIRARSLRKLTRAIHDLQNKRA